MKVNAGQASSTLIPEYIGSDFDKVTLVSENIEYIKNVAEGIAGIPVKSYIGEFPPKRPVNGAEWYCTKDGRTYVWYEDGDSSQWVESSPQSNVADLSTEDKLSIDSFRGVKQAALKVAGIADNGRPDTVQNSQTLLAINIATNNCINVKTHCNAVGDGIADDTVAFKKAFEFAAASGKPIYIPSGKYLISESLAVFTGLVVIGDGDSSVIECKTDIPVFSFVPSDKTTVLFNVELRKLHIHNSLTTIRTTHDVDFENPNFCKLEAVHISNSRDDTQYSDQHKGGIKFHKHASAQSAYCNALNDCWLQNCQAWFDSVTDSDIHKGYYWGHVCDSAIKITGSSGNIEVANVQGIITSQYKGGIYLNGNSMNQIRVASNEFDGNPLIVRGHGINAESSIIAATIANNMIWGCGKSGLIANDPVGWSVTGNVFWKNNASDAGHSDIQFNGVTIQPSENSVTGNTFVIDDARTNKGYAIKENNAGQNCVNNAYSGNSIRGSYNRPGIKLTEIEGKKSTCFGNVGVGAESFARGKLYSVSESSRIKGDQQDLSPGEHLDLPISPDGTEGFAGFLTIAAVRFNYNAASTKKVYSAFGSGTSITLTEIGSSNGTGGAMAFTAVGYGNGTIRVTNTSTEIQRVQIQFLGMNTLG